MRSDKSPRTSALFLLGLFSAGAFADCGPAGAQTAAQTPAPAVLVQPAELRSLAKQSDFIGRIEAIEKVDVRARVTGLLGPRRFQDGDAVKLGQVLFEIERAPFEAEVEQKDAQLASAQAALANADQQLRRGKTLVKTKAISESQVDQLSADQLRAAASVKEAKAALDVARINLSYTTITAPIAGRIGRAKVDPGNLVSPDTGVLATIVRDDEVRVLFPVSQREILDARRHGADPSSIKVFLKLADGTAYKDPGRLDFLDVTVDPRTDGQIVRARFPNAKHLLTDGQTVRVALEEPASAQSVTVPEAAIATDQSGPYVFVVKADNQVEQRRIKLGARAGGRVAIASGLQAGDLVVVQGQQRLRPGIVVAPQRAPSVTN